MAIVPARTMLHRRLEASIHAIDHVGHRIDAVSAQINHFDRNTGAALGSVSQHLQVGMSAIGQVGQNIEALVDKIVEFQQHLETRLDTANQILGWIQMAVGGTPAPTVTAPTESSFAGLRALNQAEDLVMDQTFDPERNSAALDEREREVVHQDWYKTLLASEPRLATRVRAIYDPITTDRFEERSKRYVEIDRLRADILHHFGPPPSTAQAPRRRRVRRSRRK
jgi:hypothetical protein